MKLNKLYSIADKENISIINHKMENKAIICEIDKEYCIGLNYSKLSNSREEKEVLAEELGHYYCNALYNINSNEEIRSIHNPDDFFRMHTFDLTAFCGLREPRFPGPKRLLETLRRESCINFASNGENSSLAWSETYPLGSNVFPPKPAGKMCSRLL